ncbi:MAG: trypsin-like serine protease [Candidatus Binatia bacterium]
MRNFSLGIFALEATLVVALTGSVGHASSSGAVGVPESTPKIVNGAQTQLRATTGLLLDGGIGICSGTMIGCRSFLTAAHCVCPGDTTCTPNPAAFGVFLQHAGFFTASAVDVHPGFQFGVASDIAVLTLSTPVTGIRPTAINTTMTPSEGTAGVIAGFGITKGSKNDFGIKRQGTVAIAGCAGGEPEPAHICWLFQSPLGPAGENSNTCNGDSGGPLFIDFGSGEVVAGVTSGGNSDSCLPFDASFDTNVFENTTFIQSVAGTDLANTSCGTISQVGDASTQVLAAGSASLSKASQRCRKEVAKQYSRYARLKLRYMQKCLDRVNQGKATGPCPDAKALGKIQKAAARVDARKIGKRCGTAVTPASRLAGGCAGAQNADDLRACILVAGDATVDAMLDAEYANSHPAAPLADQGDAKCQKAIAKAMNRYALGRLKALTMCQAKADAGKVESCPDSKATSKIARLASQVQPSIEKLCTNAEVANLNSGDPFGGTCGTLATTAALAACEINHHDAQMDGLFALAEPVQATDRATFTVPADTAVLRVTVNAVDAAGNDVDLFIKQGAPPTSQDFDFRSTNSGVLEAIKVGSPAAGTWHALVQTVAGTKVPFQLTVTTFQP